MKGLNLGDPLFGLGERKLRIELDKKALFALASDTRMEILKALQTDRKTLTQLAEALEVDKAAVHRHLKKLEEGGFVKREEDHGFVYYGLSWKARDILTPGENTRVIVLISSALVMLVISAIIMYGALVNSAPLGYDISDEFQEMTGSNSTQNLDPILYEDRSTEYLLAGTLAFLALVVIGMAMMQIHKPKQGSPRPDGDPSTWPDQGEID